MSPTVTDIEVTEDFSASARCDEGFLQIRRLRCRNRRSDGSASAIYRVDVIDRPRLDAVAVLIYRRTASGIEVLTRQNLRPAAYFRKEKETTVPDPKSYLMVEEIVAGLLETTDRGEDGVRRRASAEVREEAGVEIDPWSPEFSRRRSSCAPPTPPASRCPSRKATALLWRRARRCAGGRSRRHWPRAARARSPMPRPRSR
jgi:hypothetical protein